MGYKLLLIMFFLVTIGCSKPETQFDDIEFIAYHWRIKNYDNPELELKWQFYCNVYAVIDHDYQCKMVVERFYPNSEIKYCRINLDRKMIDSMIISSLKYKSDTDFRPNRPLIYDGPNLKIRINKNNKSKTIHYFDIFYNETKNFVNFVEQVDSLIISNSYVITDDTIEVWRKKQNFIKYCMRSDSILRRPPPPPTKAMIRGSEF
jgi:hypothetical protein